MRKKHLKTFLLLSPVMVAALLQSCKKTPINNDDIKPKVETASIELFAEVSEPVGNIAYADNGDLIYSHHPFFAPQNRVMRYNVQTKQSTPFPNQDWNTVKPNSEDYLNTVLGLRSDNNGVVWLLDMGIRNDGGASYTTPKFVGWNTRTDKLEEVIRVPAPASLSSSQLNDFVIIGDTNQVFIIADEHIGPGGDGSKAALVVVYRSGKPARRLLEGHDSTVPEKIPIVIREGNLQLNVGGEPLLVGADGIAADKDNEWLYYAPLNGTRVYRVRIEDLLNESLTEAQLGSKVEIYATGKENNGSISIDTDGNLYLTYLESKSIGVVRRGKKTAEVYATHPNLLWPDGASTGKDGYLYVPATQLYLGAAFQQGRDRTNYPFGIYRFKPIAEGLFGR